MIAAAKERMIAAYSKRFMERIVLPAVLYFLWMYFSVWVRIWGGQGMNHQYLSVGEKPPAPSRHASPRAMKSGCRGIICEMGAKILKMWRFLNICMRNLIS